MSFVSITRLRIRSVRFLPSFAMHTSRSIKQVKWSPGFKGGSLLVDRRWTFWTMTVWDGQENMRRYMTSDSHREAMPHLLDWCDEASVVHWDQAGDDPPAWNEAYRRMCESGRVSKVRFPSARHATLSYPTPRLTIGGPIRPEKARGA